MLTRSHLTGASFEGSTTTVLPNSSTAFQLWSQRSQFSKRALQVVDWLRTAGRHSSAIGCCDLLQVCQHQPIKPRQAIRAVNIIGTKWLQPALWIKRVTPLSARLEPLQLLTRKHLAINVCNREVAKQHHCQLQEELRCRSNIRYQRSGTDTHSGDKILVRGFLGTWLGAEMHGHI